jgi:hypothetical protein
MARFMAALLLVLSLSKGTTMRYRRHRKSPLNHFSNFLDNFWVS